MILKMKMKTVTKMNKIEMFKDDLRRNNPEQGNEQFRDFYIDAAIKFSEIRESYRKEIHEAYNVDPDVYSCYDKDDIYYGRLYFTSDHLNETIRDIKIIDNHWLYFTSDFQPYHFDGILTGRFYIKLSDDWDMKKTNFDAELDNDFKITIKETW